MSDHRRVHVKSRRKSEDAAGGYLYELEPTKYDGPWDLEEGTELEVVGTGGPVTPTPEGPRLCPKS